MSMFGALNRFIARLDTDSNQQNSNIRGSHGFQVLKNSNSELLIEPWFDFITGINGRDIVRASKLLKDIADRVVQDNSDPSLFSTEIRNCAGQSVNLNVWSAKGQRARTLYAPVEKESASIGVALQWAPLASTEEIWHILDVTPNSPADTAGLLPYGDYIIGTPAAVVKGESGFGELVEHHMDKPLELYIYNHEYNVTRPVTIQPSRSWGGQGALGCVLGYGALHRIPAPLEEPPAAPGEMLFETARLSTDAPRASTDANGSEPAPQFLVPAESQSFTQGVSNSAKPGPRGSSRKQHSTKVKNDMDDYFAEGEAKSKEIDHAPSPKPASSLAPPPKSSGNGPPRVASPSKAEE